MAKLYIWENIGYGCTGMAIVFADSKEEARKIMKGEMRSCYMPFACCPAPAEESDFDEDPEEVDLTTVKAGTFFACYGGE